MIHQEEKTYSVSEYTDLVNGRLSTIKVRVLGEVTAVTVAVSGHVYFTIKDQREEVVADCIVWRDKYKVLGIELKVGEEVIITGTPRVYPRYGKLSLLTDSVEFAGEGKLREQYEKLKKKLQDEGLFDASKKRPIPDYVKRVGVITSKTGAVLGDFQTNIGRFGFDIQFIDSRVEGAEAVFDLLAAIKTFEKLKNQIDVLVLIRGGGSLEALQAFNNEQVARAISNFPVPVVVGIGHDKDKPLVSFVADYEASTPSIVAKAIAYSWEQATSRVELMHHQIDSNMRQEITIAQAKLVTLTGNIIAGFKELLAAVRQSIHQSQYKIRQFSTKVVTLFHQLEEKVKNQIVTELLMAAQLRKDIGSHAKSLRRILADSIQSVVEFVKKAEQLVSANNPERTLDLGYSISFLNGSVIKSVSQTKIGDSVSTVLRDGSLDSSINNINPKRS